MRPTILFLALSLVLQGDIARGHEFWIDPLDFFVTGGEPIEADLRVGQDFEGGALSFLPPQFRRFDLAQGAAVGPVEGRIGDRPALSQAPAGEGLAVAIHVTTDSILTYSAWEDFVAFVEHKDATWTLEAHKAARLPDAGFREAYSRYAKSLVAVGNGAGADREYGLLAEIVALANPYTDDVSDGLPVRVLYEGEPRRAEQLEVFEKAPDGQVTVTRLRTDAEGVVTVPVRPGHEYMLDSVVLRRAEGALADDRGAVWESLWANLTFAVPG